ncbi:hypothetical protein BX600DRAFT_459279 [Xylariales sp. PMI_506]|nr:hypothetical protein BX600DRAFT_459279 [Xylariales sp. PMI_506]
MADLDALQHFSPRPQAREIWAFSPATFVENIAIRPNGSLLLTTFEQARLYTLDPKAPNASAEVAIELPGVTALTGIAEISPDVFAVAGGVKAGPFNFEDCMKIFIVSFQDGGSKAEIEKEIAGAPGLLINGMCALPENPDILLCAQSQLGSIFRVDTTTGDVDVAFADQNLALDTTRQTVPAGVNGIRALGNHLYFANSAQGLFGRVPITADGSKTGDVEILARLPGNSDMGYAYDDFAIVDDDSPTAYVATHPNRVIRIDVSTGQQEIFYDGGSEAVLRAPTSAALTKDRKLLYVSTGGIQVTGGEFKIVGGQVVEIQIP